MKKTLPINEDSYIRTYTHHGYLFSIASTDDKVCHSENDAVADISVKNYDQWSWETQNDQLKYHIGKEGNITFFTNRWNIGMNMAFWRVCHQFDEIELSINKQLYSNKWSSITLFITDSNTGDMLNLNSYDISLGNFASDGVFYSTETNIHNRIMPNQQKPLTLKLSKNDKDIYIEYSNKDEYSGKILIKQLENEYTSCRIGFAINLGNSMLYEWTFSNYIQIQYNKDKIMPIDFMFNPHKNWSVYTHNLLLDYIKKSETEIVNSGINLLEYTKKQIDKNRYVEIVLNDNIHTNKSDKDGAFFHQNLIYGYDDEQQCLHMLYYNFGRTEAVQMTYSDFLSDRNKMQNRNFYVIQYNPCYEHYFLLPKRLLQLYKEYRDEENISYYEPQYEIGYIIGLGCIKHFCTPEGLKHLLSDVRISHLLYERSICNRDRIQYLLAKNIIDLDTYNKITQILEEESKILFLTRSNVVKKLVAGYISETQIQDNLNRVLELELQFLDIIISSLEEYTDN